MRASALQALYSSKRAQKRTPLANFHTFTLQHESLSVSAVVRMWRTPFYARRSWCSRACRMERACLVIPCEASATPTPATQGRNRLRWGALTARDQLVRADADAAGVVEWREGGGRRGPGAGGAKCAGGEARHAAARGAADWVWVLSAPRGGSDEGRGRSDAMLYSPTPRGAALRLL